ncbi:MAG: hypothetical protein OHK93_002507 [Ramalina farinacea]|uniref:Enoyl reductase (ER) domain-containing protein n=1 Tax=Ramalina farinacea TaxID=258253 RepID=A0AA43TX84_9LECA|nr:hypothetical protein [Ramalina farinacea]
MSTHAAIVTVSPRSPLQVLQLPTPVPTANEVLIRNLWTASTPLDLHQADGGLLVTHPQVLGDGTAGTVTAVGPEVKRLKVGDRVFGFTWRNPKEKAHQEFVCAPEKLLGVVPEGVSFQEAVTLPNNFVTAFHTLVTDLHLELPWPKPEDWSPPPNLATKQILIWGGSSSVGQFALQLLNYYGYTHVTTTASPANHPLLRRCGPPGLRIHNYRPASTAISTLSQQPFDLVLDCIGSLSGSLTPISRIVSKTGAVVAVLLPVIVVPATEHEKPEYDMRPEEVVEWAKGVEVVGVRTHHYLDNEWMGEYLQGVVMPGMLDRGVVTPQKQRVVEGETMVERAEKARGILREGVSGERLVWRVGEE